MKSEHLSRRELIAGMAKAAGLLGAGVLRLSAGESTREAIVETSAGKIRGRVVHGIYNFRGVPYGASTAGENRFMAPRQAEPWAGVRDALRDGNIAPQNLPPTGGGPLMWRQELRDSVQSEDCLTLNLFTPGLNDGQKRPVMFWCHGGGGYSYGSGSESAFDGNRLARRGNVVVVSVTHRLNIFGYLDLAGIGGQEYADSGNAGLLDILAALQWVHENIARFGGNAGNVMMFGQSGGGDKVSALCTMPAAKGFLHKGAVESGSTFQAPGHEEASATAEKVLARLGLKNNQVHDLKRIDANRLLAAMAGTENSGPENSGAGSASATARGPLRFGPVVDGRVLPEKPFDPVAPAASADVPLIVGTAATETSYMIGAGDPSTFSLSDDEMRARLHKMAGGAADRLIDLYRKNRPGASASDIFFAITTDRQMRRNAILQAERKAALGQAPAYMYLITWKTPVEGGKWRSPHTIEIPFVWDNVQSSALLVGTGPQLQPLADKMSSAWLAFAHTGNPSTPSLRWPTYDAGKRVTMIFDNECQVVDDPNRDERLAIAESLAAARS